jgi:hypothetical protein
MPELLRGCGVGVEWCLRVSRHPRPFNSGRRVDGRTETTVKRNRILGALAAVSPLGLLAQSAPDASGIVTSASTTFNSVGALVATIVGFFVVVKMVKWIRK